MIFSPDILNRITGAFMVALDGAYAALHVYSLGLLSVLALIYLYLALGRLQVSGGLLGPGLGDFLWVVLRIGVFLVFALFLYDIMWNRAFMTFLQWGIEAGGTGRFSLQDFLRPSTVVDTGFKAAAPIYDFLRNMLGPSAAWTWPTMVTYLFAYWIIVLAYGFIALAVMMTLIEMKLAIAMAAVLLPWGVLTQTAALGELALGWLAASLARVLVTAALMAIGLPLFEVLAIPSGFGRDPRWVEAVVLALASVVFLGLAWVLPNRAASMGGRGMALALGSDVIVGVGMAGISAARMAYASGAGAVRGVSRMLPEKGGA